MNHSQASAEFITDIINWCQYHYGENLVALALFDPTSVDSSYPHSDINVLMVVNTAPENERECYEMVTEMLMQNIARDKSLACRVQTIGELNMLAELGLPLFEIYLRNVEIVYDPKKILEIERANLR